MNNVNIQQTNAISNGAGGEPSLDCMLPASYIMHTILFSND